MDDICISLAAQGALRCSESAVSGSKFCALHSQLYRADYLKYKRVEQSISEVFDGVETNNIRLLLRNYHRLTQAYDLRLAFRRAAIHPSLYDRGHEFRLTIIHNLLEETYVRLAAYFRQHREEKIEDTTEVEENGLRLIANPSIKQISKKMERYRKEVATTTTAGALSLEQLNQMIDDFAKEDQRKQHQILYRRFEGLKAFVPLGTDAFALFLYAQLYHRVFRTMKRQIFDLGMHVLASPWLQLSLPDDGPGSSKLRDLISKRENETDPDHLISKRENDTDPDHVVEFLEDISSKLRDLISERERYTDPDYPRDDVVEFYQGVDPEILEYLEQVYTSAHKSGRAVYCRLYRSGRYSCSITFMTEFSPRIIRMRYRKKVVAYGKHSERQYDHDQAYLVDLLRRGDEPSNVPFKNFANSLTKEVIRAGGDPPIVCPVTFKFTPQDFLDVGYTW